MDNKSILDQIITNRKAEEIAKLNAIEIINDLFKELNERERDVLTRRFGLHGEGKETLENIGGAHNLTRERIRQIETTSLKKLRQLKDLNSHLGSLKKVINQLLEEHGGIVESSYLLDNLVSLSVGGVKGESEDSEAHKRYLDFLIAKLLHNEFEEVADSKNFKNSFKIKYQDLDYLEELARELLEKIQEAKKLFTTEEIINLSKGLQSYKDSKDKFGIKGIVDISNLLKSDFFDEDAELINNNKIIYSLLRAAKYIEQNKFGHWGRHDSREIKPKTINDKIYLILESWGKPMHFAEIADKINEVGFDKKTANAATVHNELILDDKYVLVGRGLYGLKNWGYQEGTVADIITETLAGASEPLSREEIMDAVLKQRLVKKSTITLALMDKNRFEKVKNRRYKLQSGADNS